MINFKELNEICVSEMNGGKGITKAKMFTDGKIKIMTSTLEVAASIGSHQHKTSCEVVYVISGKALCILDGKEEVIQAGDCHYCPKSSTHSITNIGDISLIMLDVVLEC